MVQMATRRDDWTDEELVIAVYLYRFGWEDLGVSYQDIASMMRRKPSTIPFRFANFLSYDGVQTGLKHGGKHAREVYNTYKTVPREHLRQRAIQALLALSRAAASKED
jgi:hypothetical protein